MLSDVDIIKMLGKKIYIYPFKEQNLKGASINLTASNMAWSVTTKKSITQGNQIVIPGHDTALIMTEEIIHLSPAIGGTIHSKLTDICRGLGHDASTLNPGWFGRLVIPVHNYTPNPLSLTVGNTFITMLLDALPTKTSKRVDENAINRTDLLHEIKLSEQEKDCLFNHEIQTIDALKKKIAQEKTYNSVKNTEKRTLNCTTLIRWLGVCGCIILYLVFTNMSNTVSEESKDIVKKIASMSDEIKTICVVVITALVTNVFDALGKKK